MRADPGDPQMLTVDDALAQVLAVVAPLPPVSVPLLDALRLVLTEDIAADANIPPFRNSAMDGYAVRASDTAGASSASPVYLSVAGEVRAGTTPTHRVEPGTAIRIMTGAPLPSGADAVVRFEETDEAGRAAESGERLDRRRVGILHSARPLANVREAGEDVRRGETVLRAGSQLRAAEIGVLAALNRPTVPVHRRPTVAILSTGDEVAEIGAPLHPGQIRDSNRAMLTAMVQELGAVPRPLGIARDTVPDLLAKLAVARDTDLILTSGGVSLGDYDMVKDVLRSEGEIRVWQVRMKPGKPLAFGHLRGVPLLGLPGNPVAAAVSFHVFGRPALRKMLGHPDLEPPTVEATLVVPVANPGQRRHYMRARIEPDGGGGYTVRPVAAQGAGILTSLARANGLLVVPEDLDFAEPGMRLSVQLLI